MKLFNKQTIALLICVVTINILCITSVSYAYFTAKIEGNEDAELMTVTAGTMTIAYADSDKVELNNAIPGDSVIKKFKIENTGNLKTSYNIKLNITNNTFDADDLKVTLKKNGSTVLDNKALPTTSGYILVKQDLALNAIDTYELTVAFNNKATNQQTNDEEGNVIEKQMTLNVEVDSELDETVKLVAGY